MNNLRYIHFIVLTALSFYACSRSGKVIISFTGDIMMHIPVKTCALSRNKIDDNTKKSLNNRGFDFLFQRIKGSLRSSDIAVGNMEFPVSPPFEGKPKIFNCHPDVIPAMKEAGFTILHIGNNHILDQGEQGVIHTMEFIRNSRLDYLGVAADEPAARAGIVKDIHGIRVGFIGYAGYLNYPMPKKQKRFHLNWFYDKDNVERDIDGMRKRCDYLVMVVHTGVEYNSRPRSMDTAIMKSYINRGVDLIIGHHPHLLQPAEKVTASDGRVCYIFYSLGNFISNQDAKAQFYVNGAGLTTRDSIILRCILSHSGSSGRPIVRFEIEPILTINERGHGSQIIQTVSVKEEIESLKKRYARADEIERVDINRRILNLYQKSRAIKAWFLMNAGGTEITFTE
ncbi:MAG: hypothetical protein A2W19_07395 [Spirochaetes bacterium RBG_16_49_21]|nr:MAG: hypothetical protein A2W19_07395 [Spirochaetes bacterium RBG_16_49_21]